MCELMGMCFADKVAAGVSVREFSRRAGESVDGWGVGWYPDRALAVVKEPVHWPESGHAGFLETYRGLASPVVIAHLRHRTVGGPPTHADTHPFARELAGRDYCFAHNGTLKDYADALPLGRYRPVGGTDSEHLFCHLLDRLAARRGGRLDSEDDWRWLHGQLAGANRLGKMNVLLSDGGRLFCYHDANGHKGVRLKRLAVREGVPRRLDDGELSVDLAGGPATRGVVVATQQLDPDGWRPVSPGEMLVLAAGEVVFSAGGGATP